MKKVLLILSCTALLTSCNKAKAPDVETVKEDDAVKIEETQNNYSDSEGYILSLDDGKISLHPNPVLSSQSDKPTEDYSISEDLAKDLNIFDKVKVTYDENKEIKSVEVLEKAQVEEESNTIQTADVDLETFNEYDSFDFDNFEVVLYTDAEIDDSGEVMWDDGQNYQVVVYDNDANAYSIYDGFLQHGEINVIEDSKNPDAFTLEVKTHDISEKTKFVYENGEIKESK